MIIKVKKSDQDLAQKCTERYISRREFIEKGIVTSTLAITLPKIMMAGAIKDAMGALPACPPVVQNVTGVMVSMYCQGGMNGYAYGTTDLEADVIANSATAANRSGQLQASTWYRGAAGSNLNFAEGGMFLVALRAKLAQYNFSAAEIDVMLKARTSLAKNVGAFTQDDGGGQNQGFNVAIGPNVRASGMNRAIAFNTNSALAPFSVGQPVSRLGNNSTPAQLAALYSLPLPNGRMNAQSMANAAETAHNLATAVFGSLTKTGSRTAGPEAITTATCGFIGDVPLTDPNYGLNLFDPTRIPTLNARLSGNLSNQDRTLLSAMYNSASNVGNVAIESGGFDYHGQALTTIGAKVVEVANNLATFMAACMARGVKGTFQLYSNGSALSNGGGNATVNGLTARVHAAQNDTGGAYSSGTTFFFDGRANPSTVNGKTIGAIDTVNGSVRSNFGVTPTVAGMVASALEYVHGTVTSKQLASLGLTTQTYAALKNFS